MSVTFDTKDFDNKVRKLQDNIKLAQRKATMDVGEEVIRLSAYEVPHDKGLLQASGKVERFGVSEAIVGYNKTYAAYQHEGHRADGSHVIRQYQKGRKGKYLEDPIKQNLSVLRNYMAESIQKTIHT